MSNEEIILWHNPRCSKSRQTLELLERFGYTFTTRLYLEDPPTADELRAVVDGGVELKELVRRKEAKEEGIGDLEGDALLEGLSKHPRAIERPVVLYAGEAALGRPSPDNVLQILPTAQGN